MNVNEFPDINKPDKSGILRRDARVHYLGIGLLVIFLFSQYAESHFGWAIAQSAGVKTDAITFDLEYWRFFTYMWFHNYLALFIANVSALLLVGPLVEEKTGFPKLAACFVFCSLIAGISSFLFASPRTGLIGCTGGVLGLCMMTWRKAPNRKLMNLVPVHYGIWAVSALMVMIHYFVPDNGGDPNAALAQLGGVIGGWIWILLTPVVQSYHRSWKKYRRRKRRQERARLRRRLEELLEKISMEGINALTEQEKRTLQRASEVLNEDVPGDSDGS